MTIYLFLLQALFLSSAFANVSAKEVHTAVIGKHNTYRTNTIVRGGDSLANPVQLSSIRFAKNDGFERVVIDLEGEGKSWEERVPPYFQIGLKDGEIDVGIRGINQQKVNKAALGYVFRNSRFIKDIYIAPAVQGDLAAIRFNLKESIEVDSFYLVRPPRIIMDLRAKN